MFARDRLLAPFLNLSVNLLIEVADRAGTDLRAPQCFRNILDSSNRNARQIHLNQRFLDTALLRLVPLNDLRFKRQCSQTGNFEFHLSGFRQQFPRVTAGTRILPIRTALIS